MRVREAGTADIEVIVQMKGELIATYAEFDPASDLDWQARATEAVRGLIPRDTHLFLIAEDAAGRPLGCVSAQLELGIPGPWWPGVHASMADMFVRPEARGQGVARALMEQALAWCEGHGCRSVHLHSTPMAVKVYERLGFHLGEVKPGDERFPVMWHDFPS